MRALANGEEDRSIFDPRVRSLNQQSKIVIEVSTGVGSALDKQQLESALEKASKLKGAGCDVRLIFDGAGTQWVPKLAKLDHPLNKLFSALRDRAPAVCRYCATTFGVEEQVRDAGLILLDDYHNSSNLNDLISRKYETVTF